MKQSLILIIGLCFALSTSIMAQESDEMITKDIKHLFDINGSRATFLASIPQIIGSFKNLRSDIPEKIWTELEKEMSGEALEELVNLLVPIYKKHFTHEEIKQMVQFFESPAGKKFAEKSPVITQESMMIGQQWGMKIGEKIGKKLEEKGY